MHRLVQDRSDTMITGIVSANRNDRLISFYTILYLSIEIMVKYLLDQFGRIRPAEIVQCVRRHPGIRSHLALLDMHGSVHQAAFHWFVVDIAERHIGQMQATDNHASTRMGHLNSRKACR